MKDLELPARFLLALADIAGLKKAFDQRMNETIPALYRFKAIGKGKARQLSVVEEQKVSDFKARGRELRRTVKGLDQVMAHLSGPVDRMKQSVEEITRAREGWRSLLGDFDDVLLRIACDTTIE